MGGGIMKIKIIGVLIVFLGFYTQLLAASWVLNPLKADFFLIGEEFDFTQKGNVYEKTFRIPYDFWRNNPTISISLHFGLSDELVNVKHIEDDDFTTLPIQNTKDFYYRLEYAMLHPNSGHKCGIRCNLTQEQKDRVIKLLEFYHPNQYFKFKITFMPFNKPKEKTEKIIEFPLYYNAEKQSFVFGISEMVKTWRKYYVKIEVLEDTILPKDTIPTVIISSSSHK